MKSRRSQLDIYLDILNVIKNGEEKPTRIMYEANLSWKPLNNAISSLVDQGLLLELDVSDSMDKRTKNIYKITKKGESLLQYFHHTKPLQELYEMVTTS